MQSSIAVPSDADTLDPATVASLPSDADVLVHATVTSVSAAADALLERFRGVLRDGETISFTRACALHGLTRGQFQRLRKAQTHGERVLREATLRIVRRDPRVRSAIETLVGTELSAHPELGRFRIADTLRAQGIDVTSRRVGRVLQRMRERSCERCIDR